MILEKTTKQIILIVSALVLATTTTLCIAKRDSIANFFRSKIKQENSINISDKVSTDSSNKTKKEKPLSLEEECKKTQELIQEKKSLKSKNETQKEKSVTLKEEYKKVRKERDKTQKLLQEAINVREKAREDYSATHKKAMDLLYVPKKSPEERKAYEEKENELVLILGEQRTTWTKAILFCHSLKGSLDKEERRLGEIKKTLDEISPGWDNDLN